MSLFFKDKEGRIIHLTNERIKHIYKHQEMQNRLQQIEESIKNPDFMEEDLYRKEIVYYYKYLKDENRHIRTVVKKINNEGFILTAYLIKK